MAVPNFAAYVPYMGQSPLGSAIKSGLGAYETAQEMNQKKQEFELQKQLQVHKIAASNMTLAQNRISYLNHSLSNLHEIKDANEQQKYLDNVIRPELISIGADPHEIPSKITPELLKKAEFAYQSMPIAKEDRDFQRKVHLEEIKNKSDWMKNPLQIEATYKEIWEKDHNDPRLPTIKAIYDKSISMNKGTRVQTTPQGGTIVTMGGTVSPFGMMIPGSEKVAIPTTGGAKGHFGQGFVDPSTGEATSTPTSVVTSQLQRGVIAYPEIKKDVDSLVENLSPFLGAHGELKLLLNNPAAYLGVEKSANVVSKYAEGLASLKAAPERIVSMMNLNATTENVDRVASLLQPLKTETPKSYSTRVKKQLERFYEREKKAESALRGDLSIGQSDQQEFIKEFINVPKPATNYAESLRPSFMKIKNPNYKKQVKTNEETENDPLGIR